MNSIDLYVDNCEFYSGGQKWESVWGNIYFRMNDLCFPDSEWYDKVSSLLEMWMGAIIEFIQYDKRECTLHFMDGPFYIHILKKDRINVFVSFKNLDGKEFGSATVENVCILKETLNKSPVAAGGSFAPAIQFEKLEIHKVFRRFSNFYL